MLTAVELHSAAWLVLGVSLSLASIGGAWFLRRVLNRALPPPDWVEALREAEARYRSIWENTIEGIFQTTLDGRYLSANPALARIYGFDSPEQLMQSIGDIQRQLYVDPTRRTDFAQIMRDKGVVSGFEAEIYRRDGSVIWIEENARAVRGTQGAIEYYEGTVEDISERKKSETLFREKEAAEASNRAKSHFLANMSHELRTPLNGVIGMLDLLVETPLPTQQARYASIARSSADLLLTIINDVLDFSKIEAGKLELETTDFDLRQLVENALEIIAPRAEQKHLELASNIPPEFPTALRGDPHRLQQVLVNLLTNAVKFTPHGQVQVRVIRENDAPEADANEQCFVRIAVEDTGIGIPPDRLDRLFCSFSQVDASTTRQFGGTGLGLAICEQLVGLMKGHIGVQSRVGEGSTFWFRVPLGKSHAAQPASRVTPPELGGMRILAVDDNATNREIIFRQLSAWGFRVKTAPDAATALELMRSKAATRECFEMVILDGQMPGTDGFQLARQIRADDKLQSTPLVMLTSLGTLSEDEARRIGIVGYLTKPVRQSQLFDTIVDVAAHHTPTRSFASLKSSAKKALAKPVAPRSVQQVSGEAPRARLLLAEDNEVNRLVALEILDRAGFECDVATNGREAIDRVKSLSYDAILMDCQMPEMDGLTATREIRRLERDGELRSRGYRVPIIALTANAIEGDREHCLGVGMDGYLTKPLDGLKLVELLETLMTCVEQTTMVTTAHEEAPTAPVPAPIKTSPTSVSGDAPFDLEALSRRCLGNGEFVKRILAKFGERLPADVAKVNKELAASRVTEVAALAHTIKGSAANLSAWGLRQAASELETACRRGDAELAQACAATLEREAGLCQEYIANHVSAAALPAGA